MSGETHRRRAERAKLEERLAQQEEAALMKEQEYDSLEQQKKGTKAKLMKLHKKFKARAAPAPQLSPASTRLLYLKFCARLLHAGGPVTGRQAFLHCRVAQLHTGHTREQSS